MYSKVRVFSEEGAVSWGTEGVDFFTEASAGGRDRDRSRLLRRRRGNIPSLRKRRRKAYSGRIRAQAIVTQYNNVAFFRGRGFSTAGKDPHQETYNRQAYAPHL
ncbi:MAG: hypothetical protein KatS3mg026_0706 [Bacteroidia bacterium]|nr:MAG: hypothetical protein KatS3mg026_0706 [Bacteroidia bacterium]